jgi:hypothetical protein
MIAFPDQRPSKPTVDIKYPLGRNATQHKSSEILIGTPAPTHQTGYAKGSGLA